MRLDWRYLDENYMSTPRIFVHSQTVEEPGRPTYVYVAEGPLMMFYEVKLRSPSTNLLMNAR